MYNRKSSPQLAIACWMRDVSNVYKAARYLRRLGWSLEAALWVLLHTTRRD